MVSSSQFFNSSAPRGYSSGQVMVDFRNETLMVFFSERKNESQKLLIYRYIYIYNIVDLQQLSSLSM